MIKYLLLPALSVFITCVSVQVTAMFLEFLWKKANKRFELTKRSLVPLRVPVWAIPSILIIGFTYLGFSWH